jgi:hypothetical protein
MKKLLLTAVVALMVSAVFCTEASAQKKTKKQIEVMEILLEKRKLVLILKIQMISLI